MTVGAPSSPASGLAPYRRHLDEIDEQIATLFGERFEICRQIARYKLARGIPMMAPERIAQVRARYLANGAAVNMPAEFTAGMFELLIGATCQLEDQLMAVPSGASRPTSCAGEATRAGQPAPGRDPDTSPRRGHAPRAAGHGSQPRDVSATAIRSGGPPAAPNPDGQA